MNYLAHIYLAGENDKSMVGNLLGDFVKKYEDVKFEEDIRQGIVMHRKLDSFTDSHPVFLKSKSRIYSLNRHFKGIIIDIFYDHFLAKNWFEFSDTSLEVYTVNFYKILKKFSYCLPDKLLEIMPFIIKDNLLLSYKEISGIEKALGRVFMRSSVSNYTAKAAINELILHYDELENDFKHFFKEAIEYADNLNLFFAEKK